MRKKKTSIRQKEMIEILTKALPLLRDEYGVSQVALANKVGVSRNMISLIECGQQEMTWTQFLAIAFFFKTNNTFRKNKTAITKTSPNIVEKYLLL